MRLSRMLRENSRVFLMIFMALLLVAFLLGDVISTWGRPGSGDPRQRIGTAFGERLTTTELFQTSAELRVLSRLGLVGGREDNALDYHLMFEEARRLGVRVGRGQVFAALKAAGLTDDHLMRVQRETGMNYDRIFDIIGKWDAVRRLGEIQAQAVFESLPRLERAYRDQNQAADVRVSVLEARAFLEAVGEPTEEELQRLFEEGRARVTAHTPTELVFGYEHPARVRIEYLTLDPARIEDIVQIREKDVLTYFEDNARNYVERTPVVQQSPNDPPFIERPLTFEEARERVRTDFRARKASEVAQSIINDLHADAQRPWVARARGADGIRPAPEGEPVSFEALARKHSDYPVQYVRTDLLDAQALRRLPDVGMASYTAAQRRITLADQAFHVIGLTSDADPDSPLAPLNLNEPAPVMIVSKFNPAAGRMEPSRAVLFRVVEARPKAPPAELAEVRERVRQDWKTLRAFERARAEAESLAAAAREQGLPAAVGQATELREWLARAETAASQPVTLADGTTLGPARFLDLLGPETPTNVTRNSPMLGKAGYVPAILKEIFVLGESAPADAPHRVLAMPATDLRNERWVVAEVVSLQPVFDGGFAQQLPQLEQSASGQMSRAFRSWFDPENLHKRTGFARDDGP